MKISVLLLFSFLVCYLCDGQICTSPVYNNSGVIIRGPCPSSQVIAPVGSTVILECSFIYNGSFHSFWNITNIALFVSPNRPPNSNIEMTEDNTATTLAFLVSKQNSLDVQCGLCNGRDCYLS